MTPTFTRSSGNVFVDLGFSQAEAEPLRLRSELMIRIADIIEHRGLSQTEAAHLFGVHQPRISDLVRGKLHRFSLDTLVEMLGKAGMRVTAEIYAADVRELGTEELAIDPATFRDVELPAWGGAIEGLDEDRPSQPSWALSQQAAA